MRWTYDPPTQDGYYWVRELSSADEDWTAQHMDNDDDTFTGVVRVHTVSVYRKGKWSDIPVIYLPGIEDEIELNTEAVWNAWAGPLDMPDPESEEDDADRW